MPVKLRKVKNFRDLGGLPTGDGHFVAPGKLYRSAHHGNLRLRAGNRLFQKLGIRYVVDLRTEQELAERPDTKVACARYLHYPLLSDTVNPAVNRHNRMRILKSTMQHPGGSKGHLCDVYRHMITDRQAIGAFSSFLHLLLEDTAGGFIWHCTQGKDRAGMETAVLLMALGVDRSIIERDYLRSNRSGWLKNRLIFALITVFKGSAHTAASLMDLLSARIEYLHAAFNEIDTVYGGTDAFLRNALGLTDVDIENLRNAYLISI